MRQLRKLLSKERTNLFEVDDEGTPREFPPPPPPLPFAPLSSFFSVAPEVEPPCKRAEVGNKGQTTGRAKGRVAIQ